MAFPSVRAAVFHISMTQKSAYNQPVHRQRHIPYRYDQPPYQNETTYHAADNEVQCKQSDPSTQGAAARHDPEAHPMEAKRQPAEYPEPYIVNLSVLHAGGFENTIQDQRHDHGQDTFEEKCFDCSVFSLRSGSQSEGFGIT